MRIIDANILIYAWDSASPQHSIAKPWLEEIYAKDDMVGLPRVVLLAFLRIVTNPRIMKVAVSGSDAMSFTDQLITYPKTVIVEPGPNHWSIFRNVVTTSGVFGPSMTEAYLASLALEHGALLCSHDDGFRRFVGLKFENPIREFRG